MAFSLNKYPILLLLLVVGGSIFVFYGVQGEGRGHHLMVVSYNVGTLNGEKLSLKRIVDTIGKEGRPGLVLLQEVPDEAFLLRIAQRIGLRHHAFGSYSANGSGYGLGILSARPLVNPEMHLLEPHGHAVLTAEMVMNPNPLLVCSVHLERVGEVEKRKDGFEVPWGKAFQILKTEIISETPRSMAVEEILKLPALRRSDGVIIGGDFNTVPFSTAIRSMGRRYEDALWPSVDYFTGTYTMVKFPFKPRIDYIFHSGGMRVVSAGVIRDVGGDHYPVWAWVGCGLYENSPQRH